MNEVGAIHSMETCRDALNAAHQQHRVILAYLYGSQARGDADTAVFSRAKQTKAMKQIEKLPTKLQDEIAEQLLYDFENETAWEKTLSQPQPKLDLLAERALRESEQGKTWKIEFDRV